MGENTGSGGTGPELHRAPLGVGSAGSLWVLGILATQSDRVCLKAS